MSSQPSKNEDGGEPGTPAPAPGLDAELDRAVPTGEATAFLVAVHGDLPGRVYALSHNTVLVGRAEDADVFISDPSVSARHARIINGSQGFEIEDLDSTNGTFVGGQRIRRTRLRNRDQVIVGRVEFSFLFDNENPVDSTVALLPAGRNSPVQVQGALVRRPTPGYFPAPPFLGQSVPRRRPSERDEDEGPSFAEIVHRLLVAHQFLRRHFWVIATLVAAGTGVGLASVFVMPPPQVAVCEVKLEPQMKSNPVDTDRRSDDSPQFFGRAEQAFTHPELVRLTLRQFSNREPDSGAVDSAVGRLRLEALEDHHYRATYREAYWAGGRASSPVDFLTAHLQTYVNSETTKALKVFNAEADFLRDQMKAAEASMERVNAERAKFRSENADRLPEEAMQTQSSRFGLETRRADLQAQLRRLQGELDSTRAQLVSEGPLSQSKYQSSQVYRESLASINQKLTAAYASGLADGHPEVRQLRDEKQRVEDLIAQQMRGDTSQVDRESNAGLQTLQSRVAILQAQVGAIRSDLGDTERSLGQVRHVVGDLPRVEARIQELNHAQEAANHLHSQLFEKLKKAELQVSLERVSAESRYEIVTAPALDKFKYGKTVGLRCGIGLFMGLFMAAVVIAVREGRRIAMQTLATIDHERPSWR